MLQIRILKKYNMKIFYNNDYKNFRKVNDGKFYVRHYDTISSELIEKIKQTYKNPVFSLFISEKGGEKENKYDSYARIVCDFDGGKIHPLYKVWGENIANLEHALFIGTDLCTVETFYKKQACMYKITHYTIDKITGEFEEELLFEGKVKNRVAMPKSLKRFNNAIDAACKKLADYQCIRTYYCL